MDVFWFWLLIILLLFSVLAWPTWPYTRERWVYRRGGRWPYAPAAAAALLFALILFLFWVGIIAVAWPWYSAPAV